MSNSFEQLLERLLGGEPTAEGIAEVLGRRGFLASPLTDGFTDRQVRIYLIERLGQLGDSSVLEVLQAHAGLPPVLGQEMVADAAQRAIARIESRAEGVPEPKPAPWNPMANVLQGMEDALAAALTPPSDPSTLEAAGLQGSALTESLLALDVPAPPATGGDSAEPSQGAQRVLDVLNHTGCDEETLAKIRERLEAPEDPDRWFDVTILLRSSGHFHGALEAYDNAVAYFDPEVSSMLWSNRGLLLSAWERYEEAVASFRRALEIRPDYHRARASLGDALRRLQEFEAAAACYQAVVEAQPENAVAWDLLGISKEQMKDTAGAIRCYETCLVHDPLHANALFDLARTHCQEGSFAVAKQWHDRLMAVDPEAPMASDLLDSIDREQRYQPSFETAFAPRRLQRSLKPEARAPGQARIRTYTLLAPVNLAIEDPAEEGDVMEALVKAELDKHGKDGRPAASGEETLFLSYRWESDEHKKWVWNFADDLQKRGYQVVYDQYEDLEIRQQIGDVVMMRLDRMGSEVPELVSKLARADVFVPILSERYRRCVEPSRTGELPGNATALSRMARINPDDGWVFDEWQLALRLRLAGKMRWQAVWRNGPVVPPPFTRSTVWDFRDDEAYETRLDTHFPNVGA